MVSATIHPVSVDIRQVPTSVTGALQGLRQWQRWQRTHNFPSWQRLEGLPKWVSNWTLGNVGCVPLRIDTGNQQALETQENPMATVPFCVGRISDSLEFLALKSLCRLNSKWFPKYSHQFACWIPMTREDPKYGENVPVLCWSPLAIIVYDEVGLKWLQAGWKRLAVYRKPTEGSSSFGSNQRTGGLYLAGSSNVYIHWRFGQRPYPVLALPHFVCTAPIWGSRWVRSLNSNFGYTPFFGTSLKSFAPKIGCLNC